MRPGGHWPRPPMAGHHLSVAFRPPPSTAVPSAHEGSATLGRLGARFGLLWAGQSVSLVGDQITLIALPLLAVEDLHASTLDVGMLGSSLRLPFLLVGLPAGVWITRIGLIRSMIAADVARSGAVAILALTPLALLGGLWVLFGVALVIGTATVFFQLSYQSVVPELIDAPERWRAANTRLSLSESTSLLVGPAAGGLAVGWLAPRGALVLDVGSYAISVATLPVVVILTARSRLGGRETTLAVYASRRLRREIAESWRYVRASPLLDAIMWIGAAYNLGASMYDALIVVFAVHHLHLTPGHLGLAVGAGAVGFPLGSALSGPVTKRLGLGPSLRWAAIPSVAGLFVASLAPRSAAAAFLAGGTFLVGLGQGCFAVNAITLRQLGSRPEFRARATAVHRFASWGSLPVGAALGGVLGGLLGLRSAMLIACALSATCAWPLHHSPLGNMRLPADIQPS
jgi:MFS family permease